MFRLHCQRPLKCGARLLPFAPLGTDRPPPTIRSRFLAGRKGYSLPIIHQQLSVCLQRRLWLALTPVEVGEEEQNRARLRQQRHRTLGCRHCVADPPHLLVNLSHPVEGIGKGRFNFQGPAIRDQGIIVMVPAAIYVAQATMGAGKFSVHSQRFLVGGKRLFFFAQLLVNSAHLHQQLRIFARLV